MSSTRVWLVRHGESKWNAQQRIQGQSGQGLSARGLAQAQAAAVWLGDELGSAPVVTSDLLRARQTAEPIAAALGSEEVVDPALRERAFGRWEGQRARDLSDEDLRLWDLWVSGQRDVIGDEVGGETLEQLSARVVPAIVRVADRALANGTPHVVVVTHGGVLWQALHDLFELPDPVFGSLDNTGMSTVLFADGTRWLERVNATPHLAPGEATTFRLQGSDKEPSRA